ncbi:MAG: sigma-70 family RNA polymerase sigma factor [Calditrichaeota bacterium]|nr:sigma-70 family RNA polymerase sigma factor [Calditrichota bacterium]
MADDASTVDEHELIAAALKGDDRAREELARRARARAYRVAFRLLGSSEDARDAVQEAFLKAFRHLKSLRGERFEPWFTKIVVNVCLDERRRRRRAILLPLETDGPASRDADFALRNLVRRALALLPDRYRAVLVLRDVEGYSTRETAELLGLEEGTTRVLLLRARRRLADTLRELDGSEHL